MLCSPRYLDEKGKIKNLERINVHGNCDKDCIHIDACLSELSGVNDHVQTLTSEKNTYKLLDKYYINTRNEERFGYNGTRK